MNATPVHRDAAPAVALAVAGVSKRFPGVVANDDVSLVVRAGQVHAIVGENGAGKTTLMSMLYGMTRPDAGTISLHGRPVELRARAAAIAAGVGMVHQAFQLFRSLTVTENVVYGHEPRRGPSIDRTAARRAVAELAAGFGLDVDPDARIEDLGVGEQQRVEILKALYRQADILILDEPTVLTPRTRSSLRHRPPTQATAARSCSSHKLNEVMVLADACVMRRGRVVADVDIATPPLPSWRRDDRQCGRRGRRVPPARRGTTVLEIHGLVDHDDRHRLVSSVDLTVAAGEIVGIITVAGSGQRPLVEAMWAATRAPARSCCRASIDGLSVPRRDRGIAYVPEDRHAEGSAGAPRPTTC